MFKILVISPISIAGALIIKGLAKGFEDIGNEILTVDVRKLDYNIIFKFKPDFAIGYDYAHLVTIDAENIIKRLNIPVIHYFADDPNSSFAHSGNLELLSKLSDSKGMVFCWDKQYLNSFTNNVFYLPLGVDPELYRINKTVNKEIDIVFTGRPLTERRLTILSSIVKNFSGKLSIYSYKKHFDTSIEEMQKMELLDKNYLEIYKNSYKGFLETEQELANVYAKSKVILNITMDQGISSMNYRVLEVLASGGFLLTDYKQDTADYFDAGSDLDFYSTSDELLDKVDKYLKSDGLRDEISAKGQIKVLNNHTFKHRAKEILQHL